MERLLTVWKDTPKPHQLIVIGILLALLLFVGGGIGGAVSAWKDSRFDKKEAQRETERRMLETERERAIGRAVAAEARAVELESQRRVLEVTIAAQGERAEKAKEAIEDVDKAMHQEISSVSEDVDDCTRIVQLCERAKRLNLYPKSKACACQ
jgi:multidrug efflux pump subunit AcrB